MSLSELLVCHSSLSAPPCPHAAPCRPHTAGVISHHSPLEAAGNFLQTRDLCSYLWDNTLVFLPDTPLPPSPVSLLVSLLFASRQPHVLYDCHRWSYGSRVSLLHNVMSLHLKSISSQHQACDLCWLSTFCPLPGRPQAYTASLILKDQRQNRISNP